MLHHQDDKEENVHTNTTYADLTLPYNPSKVIFAETHATSGSGSANTPFVPFPIIVPLQYLSIFSTFDTISNPLKNLTNQLTEHRHPHRLTEINPIIKLSM